MMSQKNKKIAVLVSNTGTGTNLKSIIDAINTGKINASIVAVISDTDLAPALDHAREAKVPIKICSKKEDLLSLLKNTDADYLCLAGWKQVILDEVINAYPNRILNLHPGLIPDREDGEVLNPDGTKGLWNKKMLTNKAIENFLDLKATHAGSSIHFLTLNFDFGPVLGRVFEKIDTYDNVESLYARLKKKENDMYVEVLTGLCKTN